MADDLQQNVRRARAPRGEDGGTVDEAACALCEAAHPLIFRPPEVDDARLAEVTGIYAARNAPRRFLDGPPAPLLSACTVMDRAANHAVYKELGEHAIRFMLTQGAKWVPADMNRRAKGGAAEGGAASVTAMAATTIEQILATGGEGLDGEMLMQFFYCFLAKTEFRTPFGQRIRAQASSRFAAINAANVVSKTNLQLLRAQAEELGFGMLGGDAPDPLLARLMAFPLTLTHTADGPRGFGVDDRAAGGNPYLLTLFGRALLDAHAEDLGILNYPKNNTPSMAFKNIGHVDFVFCSIEPRAAAALTRPFKDRSRFGDHCYGIDLADVSDFAVLTLGDLDTANAKIGENRLRATFGAELTAAALSRFEERTVNDQNGHPEQIHVRTFATRSEQIFLKADFAEALALRVLIDCAQLGFLEYGRQDGPGDVTAAMYNVLMNGLYVPQVMVPNALITDQARLFRPPP